MKKIFTFLTAGFYFFSCTKVPLKNDFQILSLMPDGTDSLLLMPTNTTAILDLLGLAQDPEKEVIFRIQRISDVRLRPVTQLRLPPGTETERLNYSADPQARAKIVRAYKDTLRKLITRESKAGAILDHSECFKNISDELTVLSHSTASRKQAVIYSNLFENSELLNLYEPKTQQTLFAKPDVIEKIFTDTGVLPDSLKNVRVYFLYKPDTRDADKLYNAIVAIYKKMLTERGAQVYVQASDDNFYLVF